MLFLKVSLDKLIDEQSIVLVIYGSFIALSALFYFAFIHSDKSKVILFPIFLFLIYTLLLYAVPVKYGNHLIPLKWFIILLEPLTVILLFHKANKVVKEFKRLSPHDYGFTKTLELAFLKVFKNKLTPAVMEIAMLRYSLFFWIKATNSLTSFSYHQKTGFIASFYALIFGGLIETFAIHLLLIENHPNWAIFSFIIHIYSLLFIFAHINAVIQQPLKIKSNSLEISIGLFWNLEIPLASIVAIEPLTNFNAKSLSTINLAKPVLTQPNVLIICNEEITAFGLYNLTKQIKNVALYVDNPNEFLSLMKETS